jgi:hypothetical protein
MYKIADDTELCENSEESSEKEGRESESERESEKEVDELEEYTFSLHVYSVLQAHHRQVLASDFGAISNLSHEVVTPPPEFC